MTDNVQTAPFEIKETVINKGYVDRDGNFHPADEADKTFVQTGEDVQ